MRITFISPINMSGGVRVVAIYAKALMQMGHDVCVVSPPPRTVPVMQKCKSWLRGHGWPVTSAPVSHLDNNGLHHQILDRWRPVTDGDVPDSDVIIATWWETAEWVSALSAAKGTKIYFIQHHEIFPHLPVARCQATYRMPLHKIVVAPWLKRVMIEQYGDSIVDIVPNSVDHEQFFAPVRGKQRDPTIGFLYSTVPYKGLDITLAAIAVLRAKIPNLRIVSFGRQRVNREFPMPEGVEFHLLPPQDRLRHLYARCDVWVTASRSEGFNLPALEAMACRTPVVSTRAGWPEEAVKSGWNGILVNIEDVTGLATGMEWLLSRSDEEWKVLSANAYATASVGSWENSARLFEQALLNARRKGRY